MENEWSQSHATSPNGQCCVRIRTGLQSGITENTRLAQEEMEMLTQLKCRCKILLNKCPPPALQPLPWPLDEELNQPMGSKEDPIAMDEYRFSKPVEDIMEPGSLHIEQFVPVLIPGTKTGNRILKLLWHEDRVAVAIGEEWLDIVPALYTVHTLYVTYPREHWKLSALQGLHGAASPPIVATSLIGTNELTFLQGLKVMPGAIKYSAVPGIRCQIPNPVLAPVPAHRNCRNLWATHPTHITAGPARSLYELQEGCRCTKVKITDLQTHHKGLSNSSLNVELPQHSEYV
ncbi:hypothetical protein BDV93DRAFT_515777 [Ceratobasidium sp. AG-I]|nr:hypothetical protein BDV93DRAFT_515777 [Ceratobasidium sp. AG-I]